MKALFPVLAALLLAPLELPKKPDGRFPLSPEEGVKAWKTQPGFEVELAAAEPHCVDPVAMAFDEDGRLYVAEMLDYPVNRTPGGFGPFPEGQIRRIELDDQGRAKKSTVFAMALPAPCSVLPYDGGVLVAAAPDIYFLKDTDGDGHADVRKVVLTGFDTTDDLYRVNSLQWGIDGWIYARGRGNTPLRWGDDPGTVLSTQNMDFRFKPREKKFEAVSGQSSCFGLTMDDWGRRFFSDSARHVIQVVLPNRYLARNPFLAAPPLTREISDHQSIAPIFKVSEARSWRVERSAEWSQRKDLKGGFWEIEFRQDYMTATCGPKIYREPLFPEAYHGSYFVCDAVGNVVHRDVLRGEGPIFTASRGHEKSEFLASTDPWCSPVACETGPDGALYVVDMYRLIIEHPEYRARDGWSNVPIPLLQKYGMRAGSTMGRIYRVKSAGWAWTRPTLGRATPAELAGHLAGPSAWWRTTAQRLILAKPEAADVEGIRKAAQSPHAAARVQALWSLHALGKLDDATLARALRDEAPGVRENAIQMAEGRLGLAADLIGLTSDDHRGVRFQLALSLGEIPAPVRTAPLAALSRQDGNDSTCRAAILSSVGDDPLPLLQLAEGPIVADLAKLVGARLDAREIGAAIGLAERGRAEPILRGVAAGIRQRGRKTVELTAGREALRRLAEKSEAAKDLAGLVRILSEEELRAAVEKALATARDDARPLPERVQAASALGAGEFAKVSDALSELLGPRQPEPLQLAALGALDAHADPAVMRVLTERWRGLTPAVRSRAMQVALGRKDRLGPLLAAVEKGEIARDAIDSAQRAQLLSFPDKDVAEKAKAVLATAEPDPKLFDEFKGALDLKPDAARGEGPFRKLCLSCHQLGKEGAAIGPALTSVKDHPKDQTLKNILYPSASVVPAYVQYLIETADGQILSGVIVSASAASVTLRRPGLEDVTVLRKDLRNMVSSQVSAMPESLLKGLSLQETADLLEFISLIR